MIENFKQLISNQFEASLATLGYCIHLCPDPLWHQPVGRYPFCQVAFHTLFFTDYYLGIDDESLREQPFHIANRDLFGDYEQLEPREPTSVYERSSIRDYLDFCHAKAVQTIAAETEVILNGKARFERKNFTRAELHIYNIRHIQHHAAQLILRLRLDSQLDIPWIGSGWREPESN